MKASLALSIGVFLLVASNEVLAPVLGLSDPNPFALSRSSLGNYLSNAFVGSADMSFHDGIPRTTNLYSSNSLSRWYDKGRAATGIIGHLAALRIAGNPLPKPEVRDAVNQTYLQCAVAYWLDPQNYKAYEPLEFLLSTRQADTELGAGETRSTEMFGRRLDQAETLARATLKTCDFSSTNPAQHLLALDALSDLFQFALQRERHAPESISWVYHLILSVYLAQIQIELNRANQLLHVLNTAPEYRSVPPQLKAQLMSDYKIRLNIFLKCRNMPSLY